MTTSQVAGKGESMSDPEANRQPKHVKEWLDMVAKVQKAETELAEAKMFGLEQYNLHHKTRAERDRLREALAWYADEAHYYNTGTETAQDDKGQRARRALKRKEDELNVR